MLPITHDGDVLGFVGRRHPALTDRARSGPGVPKYLNTADTPLFHKGAQLYGIPPGPARATRPSSSSRARWTRSRSPSPAAGPSSASPPSAPPSPTSRPRSWRRWADLWSWPPTATWPAGSPPNGTSGCSPHTDSPQPWPSSPTGQTPPTSSPAAASRRCSTPSTAPGPCRRCSIEERLANLPGESALQQASQILAAQPRTTWDAGSRHVAQRLGVPLQTARARLAGHAEHWNRDPREAAQQQLTAIREVRSRLENAAEQAAGRPVAGTGPGTRPQTHRPERLARPGQHARPRASGWTRRRRALPRAHR